MHAMVADLELSPTTRNITRREREDLLRVARLRERTAKSAAKERSTALRADFEAKLAAVFSYDDDATWKQAHKIADQATCDANAAIAARCSELGIPARFSPRLTTYWSARGENASRERRVELRAVATSKIAALEAAARVKIEAASAQIQTELLCIGMSEDAQRLLEQMPSAEELMPPIEMAEAESLLDSSRARRRLE
jgi:hypothetical protein